MLLVFDLEVRYSDTRFTCLRVGTVDQSPLKRGVLIKILQQAVGNLTSGIKSLNLRLWGRQPSCRLFMRR